MEKNERVIITQEHIDAVVDNIENKKQFYKPNETAVIVVTVDNQKLVSKFVNITKPENSKYETIVLGELDSVVYNNTKYHDKNGLIKIGTGIMLQLDGNGKLDAYPNSKILDEKQYEYTSKPYLGELNELIPSELQNQIRYFNKLNIVEMITVLELKKAISIAIEANWGVQQDIEDHDFIVLSKGDNYKVDTGNDGNPIGYIPVK